MIKKGNIPCVYFFNSVPRLTFRKSLPSSLHRFYFASLCEYHTPQSEIDMGAGAFLEPLIVISLLSGGTWINRTRHNTSVDRQRIWGKHKRDDSASSRESSSRSSTTEDGLLSPERRSQSPTYLAQPQAQGWRRRTVGILRWKKEVHTPDTIVFADRLLSRLLRRLPFIVEVWYWALIYWVYQLGRAFTALTLVQGTVHTARAHALQLIDLEKRLKILWEPAIQHFFIQYPALMHWINRTYSFIHIPATILFLIWLYYATITSKQATAMLEDFLAPGAALYQARRRTMAACNLLAFVVFTAWPCMPPRLLSDPTYNGPRAEEARSYGFIDTVHGPEGESSVWTTNKFCNQYAAMPSLHFGYSLLIGLTIFSIDQSQGQLGRRSSLSTRFWSATRKVVGVAYPTLILVVIVATANHFVLDAVAGAVVCGMAWKSERLLLNLLPLEDWFLWCLRMHKPEIGGDVDDEGEDGKASIRGVLPR